MFRELNLLDWCAVAVNGITHFLTWLRVAKKLRHSNCGNKNHAFLRRLFYSAVFLKTYGSMFSPKELEDAEYITHIVKVSNNGFLQTEKGRLAYADCLVKKYASASLVVTSRLHCALPCLAVETPVLFTSGERIVENSSEDSAGRFGGLLELLNIIRIKKMKITECPPFPIKNKDDYKPLAEALAKQCEEFIAN